MKRQDFVNTLQLGSGLEEVLHCNAVLTLDSSYIFDIINVTNMVYSFY